MLTRFYEDPLDERKVERSVFLAGPTARGVSRTPWRAEALAWFEAREFEGTVILPEFRDGLFSERAPQVFGGKKSPVPGMRSVRRLVLGMPQGALSGSHIRFHAHRAGTPIASTLEDTLAAAWERLR